MADIPAAALAVMEAALEDYRTITPPDQATPAGAVDRQAMYLASEGYTIAPDISTRSDPDPCPPARTASPTERHPNRSKRP